MDQATDGSLSRGEPLRARVLRPSRADLSQVFALFTVLMKMA